MTTEATGNHVATSMARIASEMEERIRAQLVAMGLPTDPDALFAEVERHFPGMMLINETGPMVVRDGPEKDAGGYVFHVEGFSRLRLVSREEWEQGLRDQAAAHEEDG